MRRRKRLHVWGSQKSFRPKDDRDEPPGGGRNASRDFHGERRRNNTHASTTDPDARLFRQGHGEEAKLCFRGHVLMENRHGLVVEAALTRAAGFAERLAAVALVAGCRTAAEARRNPSDPMYTFLGLQVEPLATKRRSSPRRSPPQSAAGQSPHGGWGRS